MLRNLLVAPAVACFALGHAGVRAEMSGEDYRSGATLSGAHDRARVAADIDEARRRAAEATAREEAARAREATAVAERLARRPAGERLVEQRCTSCHSAAIVASAAMGPIGWRWTIERMRWFHGAAFADGEPGVIAEHLSRQQPGQPSGVLMEWLVVLVPGIGLPIGVVMVSALRRRRRRSAG